VSRPPFNLYAVEKATVYGLSIGHRVFQTHFYAEDDAGQVAFLLDHLDPPQGAVVLDAGCGVGEVSRLMHEMRPDLSFVLVNVSPYQLSLCPKGDAFTPIRCDLHDMKVDDETIDAVMFSSALCQLDEDVALAEAARVLKDGGVLLVNDMAREHDDGGALENAIAARVHKRDDLIAAIERAGFVIDNTITPKFCDAHFRELLADGGIEQLIEGVYPIVIRATKGRVEA